MSRASLVWVIAGVPVHCPTRSQLGSLTEDDYAVLMPPSSYSKTDQFGVIWDDKPMYLPVRFTTSYCDALRLRDLELVYPVPAEERENTPLFCMEPGVPFTLNAMTKLLIAIRDIFMPEVEDKTVPTLIPQFSSATYWRPSWDAQVLRCECGLGTRIKIKIYL